MDSPTAPASMLGDRSAKIHAKIVTIDPTKLLKLFKTRLACHRYQKHRLDYISGNPAAIMSDLRVLIELLEELARESGAVTVRPYCGHAHKGF